MRPEILFPLFANITTLKGVGPNIAQSLARLIHGDEHAPVIIRDVLFHLPYDVIDRRFSPPLHSAPADQICTFQVKVEEHYPQGSRMRHGSKKPHRVLCSNEAGDLMLVFFHAHKDYIEKALPVGSERIISGKTEKFDFRLQMTHPDIIASVADKDKVLVVEPQYALTAGMTNKRLRSIIAMALETLPDLPEWRESETLSFKQALIAAHHPKTLEDVQEEASARMRLAMDELIAEQLKLRELRENSAKQEGIILPQKIFPPFMGGLRGEATKNPKNIGIPEDTKRDLFTMERAKDLRREMTKAEYKLWEVLSGKKLGGYKFRRQQSIGEYVVDFVNLPHKLVIEINGGQHDEVVKQRDFKKMQFLKEHGFEVLRFWNHDVLENTEGVAETILSSLPSSPPINGGDKDETFLPFKGGDDTESVGRGEVISDNVWQQLEHALPFKLTTGQRDVLRDIEQGLASGTRYIRLLQGDVGSGKTIIALFAMLRAVEHGYQAALMVPTEIVALQHFQKISEFVEALGVSIVLLTGSVKGADRKRALELIACGEAKIIVGTHALFQEKVQFHKLALAVIDEQHRFGVNQRMALVNKGERPHLLHMTATPIPRSLMMTQFGDMQPLILKDKPHGRKEIATRVIPLSRSDELLDRLQAALARGEKAYWICPQIEDKATDEHLFEMDIAAVETRYIQFKTQFGDKVTLVHGKMNQAERESAMQRFYHGDCPLLVATTVIEVGVDVPDATIIIIECAERFGLSQLHQLRGRVGRSDKASYCILLYADHAGQEARERLTTLRNHTDGFTIAEVDYKLRGGGELLGKKQSGMKHYQLTTPQQCDILLEKACTLAREIDAKGSLILRELFS